MMNNFKKELKEELENILAFWQSQANDDQHGGFIGKMDNQLVKDYFAPKGSVMYARILWAFSAGFQVTANPIHLQAAHKAYHYYKKHFLDPQYGGVFWSVDCKGDALDLKKQVYAIAFGLYGITEFYKVSALPEVKDLAVSLYHTIQDKAKDPVFGGYFEAFTREWSIPDDMRLSDKDENEKKSMNTHLHVLEAYSNLYSIWPDPHLKSEITSLIIIFLEHIIDPVHHHLVLFSGEDWTPKSRIRSFGHDIEACWLLYEAAILMGDDQILERTRTASLFLAAAAAEGIDPSDNGLWYEIDNDGKLIPEKHWWPQAEAMVGFLNAWQLSNDEYYLKLATSTWQFIKMYILDKENGEWFWGIDAQHVPLSGEDKVGLWKCPYHNARACIEIIKRVS